jgi:hypothetical protein
MIPVGYNIDDDVEYFAGLFGWIRDHSAAISTPDNAFGFTFPGVLKVVIVPPDLSQIRMQTDANPALFVAATGLAKSALHFYEQWSEMLVDWEGQNGKNVPDPAIVIGSTILARGHRGGTAGLDAARRCLDAGVLWHEAGHAITVACGRENTEGYAYEFELCALAYCITSNSIGAFGFALVDVVEYIENIRIGQFAGNSGGQKARVKAALTQLRNVMRASGQPGLGDRLDALLPRLS